MCGRYTLSTPGAAVAELLELDPTPRLAPRYNIAPTQESAVVRLAGDRRSLAELRWGLVPYWAAEPGMGNRMINARAESAADKPAFRSSLRRRRCLVPADGFYEWRRTPDGKQPYLLRLAGGGPFAFAGLWDRWVPHDGEPIESFTILTIRPNELTAAVHDRMPVILPRRHHELWLDPEERRPERLEPVLQPFPAGEMTAFPVSAVVNTPANDTAECVAPLPDWETDPALRI
ncbi:MAG: SOS response-associated peptidase [Thermoanaerobaculia bacterium]